MTSLILMLRCSSPELTWDEASYVSNVGSRWYYLWSTYGYVRHYHGPMAIYLAKLGQSVLPRSVVSLEGGSRFFIALVGSLGIASLYWMLRRFFETSRLAALAASALLLFSVIRLAETNTVGPHHLMLACTLAIVGLGYHWRETPSRGAAIALGLVMAFAAVSMTYVIPAAICWATAVAFGGTGWITWDSKCVKFSWSILILLGTLVLGVVVLWPPGILDRMLTTDFRTYLYFPPHATLVGDRILPSAPRWAAAYWLAELDAPILMFSVSILVAAFWNAYKNGRLSSKHVYLSVCVLFFLATALAAHMAGARNLLQFMGVLCLVTGALFDEALAYKSRLIQFSSIAVIVVAALNLAWHWQNPSYTPYVATDGYRAFLQQNESRLQEKTKALVYGLPVLKLYAQQCGCSVAWDASEMPWSTRADTPFNDDVKYVLIPAFIYEDMPPEQPMRRVVADHWNVVWSFQADHVWALRLYERPRVVAERAP